MNFFVRSDLYGCNEGQVIAEATLDPKMLIERVPRSLAV
jgi:hypothetical protein